MTEIRKTHKHGGSIEISLTDFAKEDVHYKIEKLDDKKILLKEVE